MVRDHAGEPAHHVLVLATSAVPRRRGLRRRRGREAPPEPPPAEVDISRATLIDTAAIEDDAAREWLDRGDLEGAQQDALRWLNLALRAHRAAAADPSVREVTPRQSLVTRVGYGLGEQVAEGRWEAARELPPPAEAARRGEAALRPQERVAALLSARDVVLACEELALRARSDLDHGREREAALQTHLALEAAVVELQAFRGTGGLAERLAELGQRRDAAAAAANAALQGGLEEPVAAGVRETLERLEAALRARTAAGLF